VALSRGARYLYICEDGLVHYCSQQRGYPEPRSINIPSPISVASSSPKKVVRPLHGFVRTSGFVHGPLARSQTIRTPQTPVDARQLVQIE